MFKIPTGYNEIKQVYGDPKFRDMGNGHLNIDPKWEQERMLLAEIPGYDRQVYMHELIVEPLWQAIKAAQIRKQYPLVKIGCFNPRMKKTLTRNAKGQLVSVYRTDAPSLHSWGIALDINPDTNKYGSEKYDMPIEWVEEFEKVGFIWGGRWKNIDAMHFQLAKGA